jgi:UDP-N-acetylglucosamine pyrophosphorylase
MPELDPVFIGYSAKYGLQGAVKAYQRTKPNETPSLIVKKNGKYDILEYDHLIDLDMHNQKSDGQFIYNLANMQEYMLKSDVLLKICSDITDLNKLYRKSFRKIETYDEEEECTVQPDNANGYQFELYINSFFQFCDVGKFGVLMQEKNQKLASASDVESVRNHIYS